jgi:AcrR family transcriptional regulator
LGDIAEQPRAGDTGCRLERQLRVLELGRKSLELVRDDEHSSIGAQLRLSDLDADQRGEALTPLHRRFAHRQGTDLGDDVRVALSRQALEEIPAEPQRAKAEQAEDQTSDEEWRCELREHLGRDEGGGKRDRPERELCALFLAKLPKAGVCLIDRSRVHECVLLDYGTSRFRMLPCQTVAVKPVTRGRPRDAGAREAILDATLELLADRGFHATTMDAIAERAGVGKNTIYRRWPTKDDLFIDAMLHFTADLELQAGPAEDVYGRLLEYSRSVMRFYGDPLASRLIPGLLGELQRDPAFADAYAKRVVAPLRQPIVSLLELARARGELRAEADPEQVADLLVGPGFLRMLFGFALPKAKPTYPDELLAVIWRGVAS